MGEFFKGWKRKVGVVTLVMALVFMGGWIRSRSKSDLLMVRFGESAILNFSSDQCGLGWAFGTWFGTSFPISTGWTSRPINPSRTADPLADHVPACRWDFAGFHFGSSGTNLFRIRFAACYMSYWHIVVPLTLLSAYLLLTKPHKLNQRQTSEPIPAGGT